MWKLSLLLLLAANLNIRVFAQLLKSNFSMDYLFHDTLNTCQLTLQSTVNSPAQPSVVQYGILARLANSNPPIKNLTISSGGTAGLWNQLDRITYTVGFAVQSHDYSMEYMTAIVTSQWPGTSLFQMPVPGNGNWLITSAQC